MGLKLRIFLGMMAVVLLALASTGVVAYFHAQNQEIEYNNQRLERKEAALSRSLDYVLARHGGMLSADSVSIVFTDHICELADVHHLVFSLYNPDGGLIISSAAFTDAASQPTLLLTQHTLTGLRESTGRIVLHDNDNLIAKEVMWVVKNIENEPLLIARASYNPRKLDEGALISFLRRLLPVYFALLLGAMLIGYFIIQSITRPLKILREEMAEVDPLKTTKPIDYKWKDEIGELVIQYNKLLEKLRVSIEERAKFEREGAWKEMAQQVAHEIKNPLTPLRLGIQQLEKSWNDDAPDFSERLNKFSITAIDQIDILSGIASDFALLAEVRKPQLEKVSLLSAVKTSIGLYDNRMITLSSEEVSVKGDSSRLVRVFNNLISNAIDASSHEENAQAIHVKVFEDGEYGVVEVRDFGVGIPEEKLNRIFEPHFTTKTHGQGLGLAMVKKIIEQASGEVSVVSVPQDGSTFTVRVPKWK
jgi:two-component system nitrogen regulation sensor histidine kinase NtrY